MPSIALESTPSDRVAQGNTLDVALLLRAAIEGVGCPHQVAASAMGYQPDYTCRVLNNERGVVLDRLGRLPADVQRDFVTRWAEALGMPLERRETPGSEDLALLAGLLSEKRVKITLERVG